MPTASGQRTSPTPHAAPPEPPRAGTTPAAGATGRRLIGTALGLGRLPWAPGTWGSLGTVLVFGALFGIALGDGDATAGLLGADVGSAGTWTVRLAVLVVAIVLFALGCRIGNAAPGDYGRKDPGAFVLDEVVGQTLALLPLLPGPPGWLGLAVAFGAFRLFDVVKPIPCRRLEALPGGLGIMADDVAAGIYATIVVAAVAH